MSLVIKKVELAAWLSLSLAGIQLTGVVLFPLLSKLRPLISIVNLSDYITNLILFIMIFYSGYMGLKTFKNKNKSLYYNSIFVLLQILLLIVSFVISIINPDFYFKTNTGFIGITIIMMINFIYGISFFVNGYKILKYKSIKSLKEMRKLAVYLLLIFVTSSLILILILLLDHTVSSDLMNLVNSQLLTAPSNRFLNFLYEVISGLNVICISIGVSMMIMSYIVEFLLKNATRATKN